MTSETAVLDIMDSPGTEPGTTIVLAGDLLPAVIEASRAGPSAPSSAARIVDCQSAHATIEGRRHTPAFLVLYDTYCFGRNAMVDGHETRICPADHVIRPI